MTRRFAFLLVLWASSVLSAASAFGDGKFYVVEDKVPPAVPYQRALLLFDGVRETLVLQSSFRSHSGATDASLGWVVPVPSEPELASIAADKAQYFFKDLTLSSQPRITVIRDLLLDCSFYGFVAAITALAICPLLFPVRATPGAAQWRAWAGKCAGLGALLSLSILMIDRIPVRVMPDGLINFSPAVLLSAIIVLLALGLWRPRRIPHDAARWRVRAPRLAALGALLSVCVFLLAFRGCGARDLAEGVDVIKTARVGVYDVRVVKSDDADDLVSWLNHNKFHFDDTDRQVFGDYIRQGWCFVVAKVRPTQEHSASEIAAEGLVAPLIVRFPTATVIYPLALTSTTHHDTELLLYVLSDKKMQCGSRLDLVFADTIRSHVTSSLQEELEPASFLGEKELRLTFLSKFKGTLTPDQMREDLTFRAAADNKAYRPHVIRW